jgi:hypothetical protein
MRTTHAQRALLATLVLLLAVAWTVVIAVAIHVSQIALANLEMIVELAAISP